MARSIMQIMKLSPEERRKEYSAKMTDITVRNSKTTIKLKDYKAYSFFWEKTYIKSPMRANDGSIHNLNDYTTFITGHFKINFSLISIDDYREIMKLIYSNENEFTVTCYDIVYDKQVTIKMYFSPQEMPKLWTISNKIQGSTEGWDEWIELVGVEGYTVEMIGTNTDREKFSDYFS